MATKIVSNMQVAEGATLDAAGTGTIDATKISGVTIPATGSTVTGHVPIITGPGVAAWSSLGLTKFSALVGDGALTTIDVVHGLGTRDVFVTVYRTAAPYDVVEAEVANSLTDRITVSFAVAPAINEYRVVVIG